MTLQDPLARQQFDVARLQGSIPLADQTQHCFSGLKLLDTSAAKLFSLWVPCTAKYSAFLAQVGSLILLNFVSLKSLITAVSLKGSSEGELCYLSWVENPLGLCQFLSKHKKQLLKLMQFTMCFTSSKAIFGQSCHLAHSARSATDFCSLFHFPQFSCGAGQTHAFCRIKYLNCSSYLT